MLVCYKLGLGQNNFVGGYGIMRFVTDFVTLLIYYIGAGDITHQTTEIINLLIKCIQIVCLDIRFCCKRRTDFHSRKAESIISISTVNHRQNCTLLGLKYQKLYLLPQLLIEYFK